MEQNRQPDPECLAVDCPDFLSPASLAARLLRPDEDPHEFQKLYQEIHATYKPCGINDWYYFERIIFHRWALRRLDTLESAIFEQIGRAVWAKDPDSGLQSVLGPELHRIPALLRDILKARAIQTKYLAGIVRAMKRERSGSRRKPKPGRPALSRRRKIADREPVTRFIQ